MSEPTTASDAGQERKVTRGEAGAIRLVSAILQRHAARSAGMMDWTLEMFRYTVLTGVLHPSLRVGTMPPSEINFAKDVDLRITLEALADVVGWLPRRDETRAILTTAPFIIKRITENLTYRSTRRGTINCNCNQPA